MMGSVVCTDPDIGLKKILWPCNTYKSLDGHHSLRLFLAVFVFIVVFYSPLPIHLCLLILLCPVSLCFSCIIVPQSAYHTHLHLLSCFTFHSCSHLSHQPQSMQLLSLPSHFSGALYVLWSCLLLDYASLCHPWIFVSLWPRQPGFFFLVLFLEIKMRFCSLGLVCIPGFKTSYKHDICIVLKVLLKCQRAFRDIKKRKLQPPTRLKKGLIKFRCKNVLLNAWKYIMSSNITIKWVE